MGFSSQGGHVAFMTQAAPDTFPAGFATSAIAMKLKTGSLAPSRDLLIPDPEIGGGRDVPDAILGGVVWSGDYEFYARFNAMLPLLYAALGIKAVKSPGGTAEVTTLTGTGTISGGTFTITYSTQTTAALPYNATAAQVQKALEALSNIAPGDVVVTGDTIVGAGVFTLTWGGNLLGNITPPTADSTNLTGTTPGITVGTGTAGTDYVGAAVHTFIPSDDAQLPFLAIEERIGAGLEAFHYTDAVINSLHLECDANGYLQGSVGVIAKMQEAGITPLDPSTVMDELPLTVGTNITVTYNGVSLPAKSFSLDVNNNFEDDDFRLGSFYIGDLTPKRREIMAGFGIREADSSLWRQATYGSSVATEAGGLTTKQPLVITMSTYETIPGSTPTLSYKLTLTIPKATIKPYGLSASGDDIIESDIEMQALRPQAHIPALSATVVTNKTTVN